MKVYIVWLNQKYEDNPELCAIFETENDAKMFRDDLSSKSTQEAKDFLNFNYTMESYEVRSLGGNRTPASTVRKEE